MPGSVNSTRTLSNSVHVDSIRSMVIVIAILFGFSEFSAVADETTVSPQGTSVPLSEPVPPAPDATDEADSDTTKPPAPKNLSLDALLDIADKNPQNLQSINVNPASSDRLTKPDAIFKPDTSAGSAANSTGELLSQSFGVVTRMTSAINQDARLRGYSGSQVVGVANGMNQGKTRIDVDSLFSQIDPNLVESITVVPGAYTVEYGPGYAFFDAQLIAPKRSNQLLMNSDTKIGYNTNGGQLSWRETAGYSDRDSGAIVSFGQRMGGAYRPGAGSNDFNIPAAYHEQDIYVAINSNLTERSRIDGSYLHQNLMNTQLPGVAYDISNQNADQFNVRWTWRDDATGRDRIQMHYWWNQATYNGDASSDSKQQTMFSTLFAQPYPQLAGGTMAVNGLSDTSGARANILWGDNEVWEGKTGIDWRRSGQFHREIFLMADGTNALGTGVLGIPASSANDFGIFASGTANITDHWKVGLGQRVDAVTYGVDSMDIAATSLQFAPGDTSITGFSTPTRVLNTTYVTSSFKVTDDTILNAGVSYAMRPPNLAELYSNSPSAPLVRFGNSFVYGDSNLNSEKNLQFDLGLTKRLRKSTYGARIFHSEINDYIGLGATNWGYFPAIGTSPNGTLGRGQAVNANPFVPNPNISADSASLGYIYRNIDRVTMEGFELRGEQLAQPWLEFVETLNFTRATNYAPTWTDITTGQVHRFGGTEGLPGIYPMNGTATVRVVDPKSRKWTAEWQSRFARQQDYLAKSLGEVGTPGFIVHNINATYRWSDFISLRASLLNVFNLNYYEHTSLAIVDKSGNVTFVKNPGISLFMGVECTF